jgi:DNA topoisomerase-1
MKLLIVESPTKAKTIRKFLKGYYILPTYGHLLDLPVNEFGIYLKDNQIEAKYVTIKSKKRIIEKIKKMATKAEKIILATDPDREGEMIAYEIKMILPKTEHYKIKRASFHEITEINVLQSLQNLTEIKESLVNAQKGRRYLDRIFGYTLSPELWKIQKGLSAGRVQSSALKIIADRENEIKNFKQEEYFNIYLNLKNFPLKVVLIDDKLNILNLKKEELERIKKEILKIKELRITKIIQEKKKIYPPLPLDTENLQRFSFQFLKFPPKKTIFLAQKLFEYGYTTYHRTDSHYINKNFSLKIKYFIEKNYGQEYFNFPKNKKEKISFEAHEAIRPTKLSKQNLTNDFLKLWDLIFMITIASHFKPLEYLETKYVFTNHAEKNKQNIQDNTENNFYFLATNKELIFDGFAKIFPVKEKFSQAPHIKEKKKFIVSDLEIQRIKTKPPSRFNEASLIKKLKELGIGRPSTYVPILEILKKRKYIVKEKIFLKTTALGEMVYNYLNQKYNELISLQFTAMMEKALDKIALNLIDYEKFISEFWQKLRTLR